MIQIFFWNFDPTIQISIKIINFPHTLKTKLKQYQADNSRITNEITKQPSTFKQHPRRGIQTRRFWRHASKFGDSRCRLGTALGTRDRAQSHAWKEHFNMTKWRSGGRDHKGPHQSRERLTVFVVPWKMEGFFCVLVVVFFEFINSYVNANEFSMLKWVDSGWVVDDFYIVFFFKYYFCVSVT